MQKMQNISIQEDADFKKVMSLVSRNYKLFIICILSCILIAYLFNYFKIPIYKISSSVLIKEDSHRAETRDVNDYLNSSLFGGNKNFQNELWILKSSPVIEQTIKNLDLQVSYFNRKKLQLQDGYENAPFKVLLSTNHVQPINIFFKVVIQDAEYFTIKAKSKNAYFQKIDENEIEYGKDDWDFQQEGKFGTLIESPDLAFVIEADSVKKSAVKFGSEYYFKISDIQSITNKYKKLLEFNIIQKDATVIEIVLKSTSKKKGKNVVNELMNVYAQQNLNRKNHIADITINYIEKQLSEISDSLNQTEDNLQSFRSSKQLLNITEQATGVSSQYRDLQNQLAELVTRKRYYDYVAEYLENKNDFSDMIVPASMGIQDQLLNSLMSELITAQAQRSNLIQNHQERNPLIEKLNIQIENIRKTITENITAVRKTTDITIDEMNKRIHRVESEISRLPQTQRQLGGIERKYRLNDAIYNYLLEKRAEAKITQASNLPDNVIIEPANMVGSEPIIPNKGINYLIALFLGMAIPFGFLIIKSSVNNKIESQEDLEKLSNALVLGKISHNNKKTNNVMFQFPKSGIAESFRALRTNIEFNFRKVPHKILLVTSSLEGEGKSFTALNLAMSYAQLGNRTLLIDFDLRKQTGYFSKEESAAEGLSSYYIDKAKLEDIILKSQHEKLDFLPAGHLPPNPMELLTMSKTKKLLEELDSSYECIILDSTPLAQVSDAYLLMDHADVKLIIARYNYTIRKILSLILKDLHQKEVENIGIVLNDNRVASDQYGYGYGYNKERK
jgi:tyrosine-protein kinase Etk/Wzc